MKITRSLNACLSVNLRKKGRKVINLYSGLSIGLTAIFGDVLKYRICLFNFTHHTFTMCECTVDAFVLREPLCKAVQNDLRMRLMMNYEIGICTDYCACVSVLLSIT